MPVTFLLPLDIASLGLSQRWYERDFVENGCHRHRVAMHAHHPAHPEPCNDILETDQPTPVCMA